ncbi:excinuclease ABC subunit C [Candidatus Woesebacteria bacterium RBG_16_34_12]|uniref:Excinuclease ABC subunit C n=1 Tax=Candidatus Woesebacteria bacterium RBG_16_34_12 TaxID=1802480 RepID=A0A1F7X708_9BACT|nr:MAG: excinuclease ABC subunit C [Candidatus Woesebacteria bacterium RBG_16_34_12]
MWYVYILKCVDKRYCVGCTNSVESRTERHKSGYIPATKDRRPLIIYCYFAFKNKYKAFYFEKYLKTGSGQAIMTKHFM